MGCFSHIFLLSISHDSGELGIFKSDRNRYSLASPISVFALISACCVFENYFPALSAIHKSTLNKMGNPQYVQFLVNPEEMFIAVLGSDRPLAGGTSNRVKLVQTSRHYSIEFYSNTLLCALVNMIGTLDFQYSYRMSGEVDVANRVAYFSMKTLKKNERRPPSNG